MDLKKKIETAKQKIKDNAPTILVVASALATVAYVAVSPKKTIDETSVATPSSNDDYDDYVIVSTREARDRIANDSSLNLTHVDDDLYNLSVKTTED